MTRLVPGSYRVSGGRVNLKDGSGPVSRAERCDEAGGSNPPAPTDEKPRRLSCEVYFLASLNFNKRAGELSPARAHGSVPVSRAERCDEAGGSNPPAPTGERLRNFSGGLARPNFEVFFIDAAYQLLRASDNGDGEDVPSVGGPGKNRRLLHQMIIGGCDPPPRACSEQGEGTATRAR